MEGKIQPSDYPADLVEKMAKELYEKDGFNFGCLPTDGGWAKDLVAVRVRYRGLIATIEVLK